MFRKIFVAAFFFASVCISQEATKNLSSSEESSESTSYFLCSYLPGAIGIFAVEAAAAFMYSVAYPTQAAPSESCYLKAFGAYLQLGAALAIAHIGGLISSASGSTHEFERNVGTCILSGFVGPGVLASAVILVTTIYAALKPNKFKNLFTHEEPAIRIPPPRRRELWFPNPDARAHAPHALEVPMPE